MTRNIEIKARIESVASLSIRAAAIATAGPIKIFQDDTFFACSGGRLKLRAFSDSAGELISVLAPVRLQRASPTSASC